MPADVELHVVYLSYGLRALALVVGAYLASRGATLLERRRRESERAGEATGAWGSWKVTLRDTPIGAVLTLFGVTVIVVALLAGPVRVTSRGGELTAGRDVSMPSMRAPGREVSVPTVRVPDREVVMPSVAPRLTVTSQDILRLPVGDRTLRVGMTVNGTLDDSNQLPSHDGYVQAWALDVDDNAKVVIDLQSEDFDPVLILVGPGLAQPLTDDDSGGGHNARLELRVSQRGSFRLVVSSFRRRETGRYQVRLR